MKRLTTFCLITVLATACTRRNYLRDDKMGSVSRVYKSVTFSPEQRQHPVFGEILTLVRVDASGEVVMTFKKEKDYEVRGKPWRDLAGTAERGLPLYVLETSFAKQSATIEYEAWSSRPHH